MNKLVEGFLERPTGQKIAIWIGTLVFMGFVFWQYFYSAKLKELNTLQEKVAKLDGQIQTERRLVRDIKRFQEEVKQLDIKLNQVLKELPDKREIPELLTTIANLAKEAGLSVSLFKPREEIKREFYAEVPVSLAVEGTFHQIATFFDEVGQLERIVNVNQISIKEPKITDVDVRVATECTATTFRYLDESERIQASSKDDSKKRRK